MYPSYITSRQTEPNNFSQDKHSMAEINAVKNNHGVYTSGSDKEAILDLVTSRSNAQRQKIITAYKNNFGKVQ